MCQVSSADSIQKTDVLIFNKAVLIRELFKASHLNI